MNYSTNEKIILFKDSLKMFDIRKYALLDYIESERFFSKEVHNFFKKYQYLDFAGITSYEHFKNLCSVDYFERYNIFDS